MWFSGTSSAPRASGTDLFDRAHHRLHAQRVEFRVQVVEAARKQVGVHGRELEAGVAQIRRGVERDGVFLPLAAEPVLDVGHGLQDAALQIGQGAGQCSGKAGNVGHEGSIRQQKSARFYPIDSRRLSGPAGVFGGLTGTRRPLHNENIS